jgi:hypothetical protein
MLNNGTFIEYPELGIIRFEDNNENILDIKCNYIRGESCMTLEDTETLARWAIKNGNLKGYYLLEQVTKARMACNVKKI